MEIKTQPKSFCFLCGKPGAVIHAGMTDRLFNVEGLWNYRQCQNKSCGLLWLDPVPVQEDIDKTYESYYTHGDDRESQKSFLRRVADYAKKGYWAKKYGYTLPKIGFWQSILGRLLYLFPGLRAIIDFEVMWLTAKPGAKLLDVGAGSGKFMALMQELGFEVEGTEIDEEAVKACQAKNLRVKLGELSEQHYPDNSFDVITLNSVIEHVRNPLEVMQEIFRILTPKGVLVILTPNTESRIYKIYKDKWLHLDAPRHLHLFSENNLKTLAEKVGFKNISTLTTSRNLRSSLLASWDFKSKGRHQMGGPQPFSRRLLAMLCQLSNIGDELLLKAQKP